MKTTKIPFYQIWIRRILICTVVMITTGVSVFAQDILPEVKPQAGLDENLFLVRVLETLYEQWPSDVSHPDEFVAAAGELRREAVRFRQHIQQHPDLDKELATRFTDFIAALDAWTDFLANISVIETEAASRLQKDNFESGYRGGTAGGTAFYTLSQSEDVSFGQAAVASLIIGGITYVADTWNKADVRNEAKRRAVDTEARRIGDTIQSSLMQAQATARALAKMHGWNSSEIGWELSDEQARLVARLEEAGDLPALVKVAERQSQLRPRDPIPRLSLNVLRALASERNIDVLSNSAMDSYATASLIPEGGVYDDYRIGCVYLAALLASEARSAELKKGLSVYGSTKNGLLAVSLWRNVLEMSPSDPTGEVRELLARALMGVNSLDEAFQHANDVISLRESDPEFCYNYACLLSRAGSPEKSLQWLDVSIKRGCSDVTWAWNDPDLNQVRQSHSKQFAELFTPKWSWRVTDDWVWDDVFLKNDSAFPLSGVRLSVTLYKGQTAAQNAYQKTLELKCEYLAPGQSKGWIDVVVGAEGCWDMTVSKAALFCDQNPGVGH